MKSTLKQLRREEDSRNKLTSGTVGGYLFDGGMTESLANNMQPLRKQKDLKAITATLHGGDTDGFTNNGADCAAPAASKTSGSVREGEDGAHEHYS